MSCPERQIENLIESVSEAIARVAREESALTKQEIHAASAAGINRAFLKKDSFILIGKEALEDRVLQIIRDHTEKMIANEDEEGCLDLGGIDCALQNARCSFDSDDLHEVLKKLEEAGLIFHNRTDDDWTAVVTKPRVKSRPPKKRRPR